jgi:hypothetical protein
MKQLRPLRPSAEGWHELTPFAPPVFKKDAFAYLHSIGAGVQAAYLEACHHALIVNDTVTPLDLGWQTPPAALIPVVLSGVSDADWSLDADELKL